MPTAAPVPIPASAKRGTRDTVTANPAASATARQACLAKPFTRIPVLQLTKRLRRKACGLITKRATAVAHSEEYGLINRYLAQEAAGFRLIVSRIGTRISPLAFCHLSKSGTALV